MGQINAAKITNAQFLFLSSRRKKKNIVEDSPPFIYSDQEMNSGLSIFRLNRYFWLASVEPRT
jgi:hypothetical protein